MRICHLTASTLFGGPERQMLGLAQHLGPAYRTDFVSFAENGRCRPFLAKLKHHGFDARALSHDTPHLARAARELGAHLQESETQVLCCHGYKANLVGRMAARHASIPAVAVARGWTGENLRVRLYETLDRFHLRWMDHIVCVSHAQAAKVRACGVRAGRISVIHNAVQAARFQRTGAQARQQLEGLFGEVPELIVGAAGRLSPEKGFDLFVQAGQRLVVGNKKIGFILFGEGVEREPLEQQIRASGLQGRFVLAGHCTHLDALLPALDVLVLPSFTEGLPNVVLEACAASVAVVATAVGGTPEVVDHGISGLIVPVGDVAALADACRKMLTDPQRRTAMGRAGRAKVVSQFTFSRQAQRYEQLFQRLASAPARRRSMEVAV
jgi:glycosyltransferase involved in cell wall biosynthesis